MPAVIFSYCCTKKDSAYPAARVGAILIFSKLVIRGGAIVMKNALITGIMGQDGAYLAKLLLK